MLTWYNTNLASAQLQDSLITGAEGLGVSPLESKYNYLRQRLTIAHGEKPSWRCFDVEDFFVLVQALSPQRLFSKLTPKLSFWVCFIPKQEVRNRLNM